MIPSPRLLWLMFGGLIVAALPTALDAALWPAVIGTWGVLAALGVADLAVLAIAKPSFNVSVPTNVGVGSDLQVRVEVSMRAPRTLRATMRTEVDHPLIAYDDQPVSVADGTTEHQVAVEAPRRGGARVRAMWLRVDGPFRLFRRITRHAVDAKVAVVPNADRVRELALAHFGAQRLGGMHVQKRKGDGGEFDALEAYEPGMDLRKVDWKASARHQQLKVRRFRLEQNQRVIVCVDTGRLMADPIQDLERLDHAIHATLLLSRVALKAGDLVGMQAYASGVRAWVPPSGGMRQLARLRRGLADLSSQHEETNHVLGVHQLLRQLKRRSLIVVFTEFTDATTAELMVEYLGHLARRHLVVFVALDDPAIQERIASAPKDARDLAATVVAGGMRADRERVLRRLRRMGVDVVHAPPGLAALQLLARYVHVKRRGLIG